MGCEGDTKTMVGLMTKKEEEGISPQRSQETRQLPAFSRYVEVASVTFFGFLLGVALVAALVILVDVCHHLQWM
jgi:hypothetical protein